MKRLISMLLVVCLAAGIAMVGAVPAGAVTAVTPICLCCGCMRYFVARWLCRVGSAVVTGDNNCRPMLYRPEWCLR